MGKPFIDYYEALQVSPHADSATIERVFRHLAKRAHPDNASTGDREEFEQVMAANRVLSDPEKRAAYDVRHQEACVQQWGLVEEAAGIETYDEDQSLRDRLLSLLYVQRRRDIDNPALGNVELEKLLGCPAEHLEFHFWYLREKKLVERTDRGFAITADGVDHAENIRTLVSRERLIPDVASR